jgi:hypothetical protein
MTRIGSLLIALALLLGACGKSEATGVRAFGHSFTLTELEVIQASFDHLYTLGETPPLGGSPSYALVDTRTSFGGLLSRRTESDLRKEAKGKGAQFLSAFKNMVAKDDDDFVVAFPKSWEPDVRVMEHAKLKSYFQTQGVMAGWVAFYEDFPDAIGQVDLSRPGISDDGSIALIYVGVSSGGLAGSGTFRILMRVDGAWIVQSEHFGPFWIS